MRSSPRLSNIQVLRFAAAAAVVQYHTIDVLASYGFEQPIFSYFKGWGSGGVDLFFVISGFVLFKVCLERDISGIRFILDRIIRIVPMYWFATVCTAIGLVVFSAHVRFEQFDSYRLASSLFFLSGVSGYHFPTLGVGWTLEYEFLFYTLLTLTLLIKRPQSAFPMLLFFFGVLFYFNFTSSIVFEFILGMAAAVMTRKNIGIGFARALLFGALLLFVISFGVKGFGIDRFIIYGFPSFILVWSLIIVPQCRSNVFTLLGDASFSIYLTHQPLLAAIGKIAQSRFSGVNGDIIVLLTMTLLIVIGLGVYLVLERHLVGALKRIVSSCFDARVSSQSCGVKGASDHQNK